ncbi:MAG: hypothetical protein MZV70_53855, partial [Desulfobacterales bacterium]|nr:hypothetical protein [Desulfobacterales bacterium]
NSGCGKAKSHYGIFSRTGRCRNDQRNGKKISVRMPSGTDVTNAGSDIYHGSRRPLSQWVQPLKISGVTPNDFTKPVVYTVTAAGSSTTYTVKINDYVLTKREYDADKNDTIETVYYYSYYTDGRRAKDQIDSDNNGTIDSVIIYGYDARRQQYKS